MQPPSSSSPQIPPHIVVLADSSLALAAEWDQIVAEYLFPMLKSLTHNPNAKDPIKIRIAVVTYAAANVRPSPLVTKQFFTELQILRELQLEPYKLGIGQHPTGQQGLAALEGFVAAIELFDLIRECIPLKEPFPLHIFHLAASHKDDSECPRWNDSTSLDAVQWDSLPAELRKRNIHLSTICVGKLAEFSELYKQSTAEGDTTQPWFPTRPPHQVLISGLGSIPAQPTQTATTSVAPPAPKRTHDLVQPERPQADVKRAKPSSEKTSPMVAPAIPPPPTAPPSAPPPSAPQAPSKHSAAPTVSSLPASLNPQQFGRYRHLLEVQMHATKAKIDAAVGRGDTQEAENLKKQFETSGRQLMTVTSIMKAHAQRTGGEQQQPTQSETPSAPPAPGPTSSPALSNHPPPSQDTSKPDATQLPASQFPPPPHRGSPADGPQTQNPLGHQRQRSLQDLRDINAPSNPSPSLMNRLPPTQQAPEPSQNPPQRKGLATAWQGTFSWSGLDPNTQERKEVQTSVSALLQDVNPGRPDTWPANLTLHPTTDRAVSQPELHAWLKRFGPGLCTFQSLSQEGRQNEANFRSLINLLLAKNIYATASWTTPSGAHTQNMLIFPTTTGSLCGAVFPLTGIPELPKPNPQPPVPAGLPNLPNFSNQMRQQFARMTPEQRQNFMHVARQRQLHMSQQQQQGAGQGFPPNMNMNMQGAGAGMGGGGGFPGAVGVAGMQPGLANAMQRFGIPPGTNAEQMQAFLQSSFGGGNPNQLP